MFGGSYLQHHNALPPLTAASGELGKLICLDASNTTTSVALSYLSCSRAPMGHSSNPTTRGAQYPPTPQHPPANPVRSTEEHPPTPQRLSTYQRAALLAAKRRTNEPPAPQRLLTQAPGSGEPSQHPPTPQRPRVRQDSRRVQITTTCSTTNGRHHQPTSSFAAILQPRTSQQTT